MSRRLSIALALFLAITTAVTLFVTSAVADNEEVITYKLTITENADGTYTATATLPDKIESGKIVISVSEDLAIVEGSAKSSAAGAVVNETYSRDGNTGACVSFASATAHAKGTVALTVTYTATEGAVIDASDFTVPEWNLSSNSTQVGSDKTADVEKEFKPLGNTEPEDSVTPPSENEPSTDTSVDTSVDTDTSTDTDTDTSTDSSIDTSTDVSTGESTDTSTDVSDDTVGDTSTETSTETSDDEASDTESTETSTEASTEDSAETSTETSTENSKGDDESPETGDSSMWFVWVALAVLACGGVCAILFSKRSKATN